MKPVLQYFVFTIMLLSIEIINAQTFVQGTLPGQYYSGGVTGVWDMNSDGLSDIVVMDQSTTLRILFQQPNGSFTQVNTATSPLGQAQWGMTVGDYDNDGFGDVMCGGNYDGVHFYNIDGDGNAVMTTNGNANIFMQACLFGDIDNDGWLDAFACHDDGASFMFRNDGAGMMVPDQTLINYNLYQGNYPGTNDPLMSGNYGNEFSDFDRDGDMDLLVAKCRQASNDPLDPRRTNLLFVNDGNNVYTDDAAARGLVNLQQSWTATFGDIDNDGDFDCFMTTHSGGIRMYENNGLGYFTDISQSAGLTTQGFFMQGQLADFDNDGFLDVLHAGGSFGYYHNNGNNTFTQMNNLIANPQTMHGYGLGDLNNDGFTDIYANYGNANGYVTPSNQSDILWLSQPNGNHWVGFDLEGTISNRNAVGALVEIHGPWGTQIREIRSGVSYGITNSNILVFGIGSNTSVDYAVIHWPAGGTQVVTNPTVDAYTHYLETPCFAYPMVSITSNGATSICPGDSVQLGAFLQSGTDIFWSNGQINTNVTANETELFTAYAFDSISGCSSSSEQIEILILEQIAPTIDMQGQELTCEGSPVLLTASPGISYLWNNGWTEQILEVNNSGEYSVQVDRGCGFIGSEEMVSISIIDAPSLNTQNYQLDVSGDIDMSVIGTGEIGWYDDAEGVNLLAIGSNYSTYVNSTSTYYVEAINSSPLITAQGGNPSNSTSGQYSNSTFHLLFDAAQDMIIDSVMVYALNAGQRNIELITSSGVQIASGTFDVPAGQSYIALNFAVPHGTGYGLRPVANSQPGLWRDGLGSALTFPYQINDASNNTLATITGTTVQQPNSLNYYYYFYDWHISAPTFECSTGLVPITVYVGEVLGCNNLEACNYNSIATVDDGTCVFPELYYNCIGQCLNDADNDGICNENEILGCTDAFACNYNPNATVSDASCLFLGFPCDDGNSATINDVITSDCVCAGTQNTVSWTFRVDMSTTAVNSPGVFIAGTFQGWVPNQNLMTDADGDNVWEITFPSLPVNTTIEYKFLNGTDGWESSPELANCGVDDLFNAFNRADTIGTTDAVLPIVCFNSCAACNANISGCTNSAACNYNPSATQNDGSCILPVTPAVTISSSDADNSICSGTSVTFTATPTNGGTAPSYQWKLNGANVGTNSATYTNSALTNGAVVSVVMTANNVCQTSSTANANSITTMVDFTLNFPPTLTGIDVSQDFVCPPGVAVDFAPEGINLGSTPVFNWTYVNAYIEFTTYNTETISLPNLLPGEVVSLSVTLENACHGQIELGPISWIAVDGTSTPSVKIALSNDTLCRDSPEDFVITAQNEGVNPLFLWYVNDTLNTTGAYFSTADISSGDTIYLGLLSDASCLASVDIVFSDTIIVTFEDVLNSTIEILLNGEVTDTICSFASTSVTAGITNPGITTDYEWWLNGVLISDSFSFESDSLQNGDLIKLIVSTNNSCQNIVLDTVSVNVKVIDVPIVTPVLFTNPAGLVSPICALDFTTVLQLFIPELNFTNYTAEWTADGFGLGVAAIEGQSITLADLPPFVGVNPVTLGIQVISLDLCLQGPINTNTVIVLPVLNYYLDADGDGFGNGGNVQEACAQPQGFVSNANDCNDAEVLAYTGAVDLCDNGIDEDCSGADSTCIILGCTDFNACNFNSVANTDDASCTYPLQTYLTCDGSCINDTDGDGVCEEIEIAGCTDITACNYDPSATDDNASCTYPSETYLTCDGTCINDSDGDGVCDEIEIAGCTDPSAFNYNPQATNDDGSCEAVLTCDVIAPVTEICEGESVTLSVNTTGGAGASSQLPSNLQQGLVAYYPFNGNANDESGNGNNGMVNGATLTSDRFGNSGSAYGFDGVNDLISVPSSSGLNTMPMSLSFWVKTTNLSNAVFLKKYCCAAWNGFSLEVYNPLQPALECAYYLSTCQGIYQTYCSPVPFITNSTSSLLNGNWHQIVFVVDASGGKVYLDGEVIHVQSWYQSSTPNNSIAASQTSTQPLSIGGHLESARFLNGSLDDIFMYNRALSPAEIQQLFTVQSYAWSTNETTPTITVSPTQTTTYTATVTTATQTCTDSITITVNPLLTWYADADADGFGNLDDVVQDCNQPQGYTADNTDCNDDDATTYPGASEICDNNRDENCDGVDSLCFFPILGCTDINACNFNPEANTDDNSCILPQPETCNGLDDNCNGQIDEGFSAAAINAVSATTALYPVCSGNSIRSANLNNGANSALIDGNGNDLWFSINAQFNTLRAGLSAATGDNDVRLYTIGSAGCLELIETEHEITTGNQVLLSDQLTVGQTYYVAVHNISGPMNASAKICFNHLNASTCDHYYSNNTGIYNSVCNSFKAQYRANAVAYTFDILSATQNNVNQNITPWSYTTTSASTVVPRLGTLLPANQGTSAIVYTLKVPVLYSLIDAAGNFENLFAQATTTCTVTLNAEQTVALRISDRCPTNKSLTSTIAPDRTVCGAMRYDWEFTQVLPTAGTSQVVQGGNYTTVFFLSNVPGITVGKTYSVRVRPVHSSGITGNWGAVQCLRVGSAGMINHPGNQQSENESGSVENIESRVSSISIYPNPTSTGSFVLQYNGARRGELIFAPDATTEPTFTEELVMMDITGKVVFKTNVVLNGNIAEINFGDLESGLYLIDFGGERSRLQVVR